MIQTIQPTRKDTPQVAIYDRHVHEAEAILRQYCDNAHPRDFTPFKLTFVVSTEVDRVVYGRINSFNKLL